MTHSGTDHGRLEELIAADALDGLDEKDELQLRNEMSTHGPDCKECARLVREYWEVAGSLALSLEPKPVTLEQEDRLLAAARKDSAEREPTSGGGPLIRVAPEAGSRHRRPGQLEPKIARARRSARERWVATAAIAAAMAIIGGIVGYGLAREGSPAQESFIAFASHPETRLVTFPTKDGQQLAVACRAGESRAWLVGAQLVDPPKGKVYELWFQPGPEAEMQPAGTFVPEDGTVLTPTTVGPLVTGMAVTVEPEGGSQEPTGEPIFVATV